MSDRKKREQEILNQEMSQDEMETVAGGWGNNCLDGHQKKTCDWNTAIAYGRPLRNPDGSMNCSATVEDGSHCWSDDACYRQEVEYMGLTDCSKAWQ